MKTRRTTAAFLLLVAVVAFGGCKAKGDNAVLAKVNHTAITVGDFKHQLQDLPPDMQQAVATDQKAREEFLEDLIGIELVVQEAKRMGLDRTPDFKKRQEDRRKEYEQRLKDDAQNDLFNMVLKKAIGDKMMAIPEPTDKEVRDYYEAHKDKIRNAAGRQLSFKEVEPHLKSRLLQDKRRNLYLEYAKELRAKAKITVNDKALQAAMQSSALPGAIDLSHMTIQPAPAKQGTKKQK